MSGTYSRGHETQYFDIKIHSTAMRKLIFVIRSINELDFHLLPLPSPVAIHPIDQLEGIDSRISFSVSECKTRMEETIDTQRNAVTVAIACSHEAFVRSFNAIHSHAHAAPHTHTGHK